MQYGSPCKQRFEKISNLIGVPIRRLGHSVTKNTRIANETITEYMSVEGRKSFSLTNGVLLVASDAHYWPGLVSTAHRAFVKFAHEMRPSCVIMNGDGFDGAQISRYPRIGWDKRPTVKEELKAVKQRLTEIEDAARTKNLFWPLGNHDARFETFLAAHASEFEGVQGFHLKDHFPLWMPCWSVWINDDVVVRHRYKGGVHATYNNAVYSGKTVITGHLHAAQVRQFSDYNGTRWGVDCGTLASPYGPQFSDYTEDRPVDWRSAFAVLTFWKGRLLMPELVQVMDEEKGLVMFRGAVIKL